jgi:hypothetical protein
MLKIGVVFRAMLRRYWDGIGGVTDRTDALDSDEISDFATQAMAL